MYNVCALECKKKKKLKTYILKENCLQSKQKKCVEHNPHEGRPWCYKNVEVVLNILRS